MVIQLPQTKETWQPAPEKKTKGGQKYRQYFILKLLDRPLKDPYEHTYYLRHVLHLRRVAEHVVVPGVAVVHDVLLAVLL